jgi:hypothetical protein
MQNTKRNTLRSLGSLALAVGLGACATPQLYSDRANAYTETMQTVLSSQDGRVFVAVGRQYHYVFDNKSSLLALLRSDLHRLMTAEFQDFQLSRDNTISGKFKLRLQIAALSPKQLQSAFDAGFKPSPDGALLVMTVDVQGRRYDAGGFHLPASGLIQLNKAYTVRVYYPSGVVEKVLMTPLALTADGIIITFAAAGLILALHPLIWVMNCFPAQGRPDHILPCPSKN